MPYLHERNWSQIIHFFSFQINVLMIESIFKKRPHLLLDKDKGIIELKGSSIMEDAPVFYEPIMEWVFEYIKDPKDTLVNIDLEYFNSASAKILHILIKTLSTIERSGYTLTVNWYFEEDDEDIRSCGHDFSLLSKVKFNLMMKEKI